MTERMNLQNIVDLKEFNVEFNSNETIREEGLYHLDNESYFVLIPNYISKQEQHKFLVNTQSKLKFEYKSHLNKNLEKRQTDYYGPKYVYGDIQQGPNHAWNIDLLRMKAELEIKFGIPLNSVLINKYNKDDHIPALKDNERCLRDDPFIFSISFGEYGKMIVQSDDKQKTIEVSLKSGTLLIMGGGFNRYYKHSVERTNNNKARLNCTFRFIYDDIPSSPIASSNTALDPVLQRIEELSKQIQALSTQVNSTKEDTNLMPNLHPEQESVEPTKAVILNCKNFKSFEANKDTCRDLLNKRLQQELKLSEDAISDIEDYRDKKGPVVLVFKDQDVKVSALKNIKCDKSFTIRNCLSRKTLLIRKKAISLVNKGVIFKWWISRGDVCYTLYEGGRPMLANSLADLERQERACLFTYRRGY